MILSLVFLLKHNIGNMSHINLWSNYFKGDSFMNRKKIIINGNNFDNVDGFRNEINRVLTSGEGLTWTKWSNLDAFNDFLRGDFGVHEYYEPIVIIWENANKSKIDLGYNTTVKYYEEILKVCHPTNANKMKALLENAKQKNGDTLFEIIIEIIKEHDHIELILR